MPAVTFTGSAELVQKLQGLSVELRQDALLSVLAEAGEPMRQRMSQLAPRGDEAPHLADHIVMKKATKVNGVAVGTFTGTAAIAIGPSKGVRHAMPVEMGFTHVPDKTPIAARPYVRPAFEEGKANALNTIGRGLWDLVTGRGRSATSGLL